MHARVRACVLCVCVCVCEREREREREMEGGGLAAAERERGGGGGWQTETARRKGMQRRQANERNTQDPLFSPSVESGPSTNQTTGALNSTAHGRENMGNRDKE